MTKQETITFEYEHCGECPHPLDYSETGKLGHRCGLEKLRIIKDLWGTIPSWCPLEDKEGVK